MERVSKDQLRRHMLFTSLENWFKLWYSGLTCNCFGLGGRDLRGFRFARHMVLILSCNGGYPLIKFQPYPVNMTTKSKEKKSINWNTFIMYHRFKYLKRHLLGGNSVEILMFHHVSFSLIPTLVFAPYI